MIAYYSGWLHKPSQPGLETLFSITDNDKNALMATVHELDRALGLDLILHTPGGEMDALESIVDYLRRMFGRNIRAVVPQIAMSAGTMLACACREIVMGKPSNLGPIDPQFGGISANGVLKEFEQAKKEVKADPEVAAIWSVILNRYHPSFLGECQKAVAMAEQIVGEWLETGMLRGQRRAGEKARSIAKKLFEIGDKTGHSRHIHVDECEKIGLKIVRLENEPNDLQDKILTVHHAYVHTLANTSAVKIIENHLGRAMVIQARQT